jgi:hypothetical protein
MPQRMAGLGLRYGLLSVALLVTLPTLATLATAMVVTRSPTTTTITRTQQHTVRYEVTGMPGSRYSVSYVSDSTGSVSTLIDQPVPWQASTTLFPVTAGSVEVTVTAVQVVAPLTPDPAKADCEIIADGRIVAENHTTSQPTITCDASLP